jgi:hypothetical protein
MSKDLEGGSRDAFQRTITARNINTLATIGTIFVSSYTYCAIFMHI